MSSKQEIIFKRLELLIHIFIKPSLIFAIFVDKNTKAKRFVMKNSMFFDKSSLMIKCSIFSVIIAKSSNFII